MKNKGFTMVPNQVINSPELSNNAKMLFIYIRSLSAKFRHLRNKTLMKKLDLSINTLQNCKRELVKNGYLVINRGISSNYYQLRLSNFSVGKLSDSTQPPYVKATKYLENKTIIHKNNTYKPGSKGFKKFNE
jgi:hypothetical protein